MPKKEIKELKFKEVDKVVEVNGKEKVISFIALPNGEEIKRSSLANELYEEALARQNSADSTIPDDKKVDYWKKIVIATIFEQQGKELINQGKALKTELELVSVEDIKNSLISAGFLSANDTEYKCFVVSKNGKEDSANPISETNSQFTVDKDIKTMVKQYETVNMKKFMELIKDCSKPEINNVLSENSKKLVEEFKDMPEGLSGLMKVNVGLETSSTLEKLYNNNKIVEDYKDHFSTNPITRTKIA